MKKFVLLTLLFIGGLCSSQKPTVSINGAFPPFIFSGIGVSQTGSTFTFGGALGTAGGDLTGTYPNPTISPSATPTVAGLTISGLPSGRCVQTTTGGQLTNTAGACGTSSGTLTATGSPVSGNLAFWSGATSLMNGNLTGDVTTSGTSATTVVKLENISLPTLAASTGLLYDTNGVLSLPVTLPTAAVPGFTGGDVSNSAGSLVSTLATVNSNTGSFGSATSVPVLTLDGKGRVTAASLASITASVVGTLMEATGGGTAQAQTVTLSPIISSLTNGLEVRWIPVATNTATAPTLAVNGLTATTITKCGGQALTPSDIPTTMASAVYTGSTFDLMNPVEACSPATNYYSSFISSNATMTSAATFYDVASITIPPGVWIVRGAADVIMGAANSGAQCSIRDSSNTIYASGSAYIGGGAGNASTIHIITPGIAVTLSTSTTYKTSCAGTTGGGVIQANPLISGTGNTSGIDAFRIK